MTLSGWLRDYLYIPLGGSHCSIRLWIISIMITFLLCGLWHGAAWTFVAWGGYFGLLIILERPFREHIQRMSAWLAIPVTNIFVIIGWVFFKASNLGESLQWLRAMFGFGGGKLGNYSPAILLILIGCLQVSCWCGLFKLNKMPQGKIWNDVALVALLFACFVSIMGVKASPFLYYQF